MEPQKEFILTHRHDLAEREAQGIRYIPVQSMTGKLEGIDPNRGGVFLTTPDGEKVHISTGRDAIDTKIFHAASKVLRDQTVTVSTSEDGKKIRLDGRDATGQTLHFQQEHPRPAIPTDLMDPVLVNADRKGQKVSGTVKAVYSDRKLELAGEEGTPNKLVQLERNERYSETSMKKMIGKNVDIGFNRFGGLSISKGTLHR